MKAPRPNQTLEIPVRQQAPETLGNDYTGVTILVGALMIATGCLFMWLSVTFPFSLTTLVWGSITVCASLFFRHKAMDQQVRYQEAALKLERERM